MPSPAQVLVQPDWGVHPVNPTQPLTEKTGQNILAALSGASVAIGGVASTVKFATINAASSGDNALVALVSGKKIRVLGYVIIAGGTVNATFRSASTAKTGAFPLTAQAGAAAAVNAFGWFETAAGEALNLNLSGAVQVSGHLTYIEV